MAQNFVFPPGFSTASPNASVGTNGAAAPTSSTQVAGQGPTNLLTPLTLDASNRLIVSVGSSVLPTGSATAANQVLEIAQLTAINANTTGLNSTIDDISAATPSKAILIGADQGGALQPLILDGSSNLLVAVADTILPPGAATAAKQDTGNASLSTINTSNSAISASVLGLNEVHSPIGDPTPAQVMLVGGDQSGAIQPFILDGSSNLMVAVGDSVLPTGAATASKQDTGNASLATIATNTSNLNQSLTTPGSAAPAYLQQIGVVRAGNLVPITQGSAVSANSIPVVIASDQASIPAKVAGKAKVNIARNDYTGTPVTTAAYVTLIPTTSAAISEIFIFDSSGQTLVLAVGAAGLEVDQIYIVPGGNGIVPLAIAAGVRVSIKAVSANATVGEIDINCLG